MRPDAKLIEDRFKESIDLWVTHGVPPGSFVFAVLTNDLREAIGRADEGALDNLPHIVAYLYNDCPARCWGTPKRVQEWEEWIATPENQTAMTQDRQRRDARR